MEKDKEPVVEAEVPALLKPLVVEYCPICTLPFEYCAWTPKAQKCQDWKQKNRPELLAASEEPALAKDSKNAEGKPQVAAEQPKAEEDSGKKYIIFDVKERMKKKFITTIWGLVANKIDAKTMSKKCSKKFACSCSVVDEDRIQIQGDVSEFLFEFLEAQFKIKDKYVLTAEEWQEKLDKAKKKEEKKKAKDAGGEKKDKEGEKAPEPQSKQVQKPKESEASSTTTKPETDPK